MLQLHDSFTRTKREFKSIIPNEIKIYVCGITVDNYCHIGHARSFIVFDMIVRYLRFSGYKVKFVRNITDVDDKIIKRAAANNEPVADLTERLIIAMHEDMQSLNLLQPDLEPRATEYIEKMLDLIKKLIDKDHAYQGENGDVYYDINKFDNYGQLSNRELDQMQSGARVNIDKHKKNPADFVLWKSAKQNEISWESPWGAGRPGWHLECSTMALDCLGETFDIHGGGLDLKFPHHENEIAQAEAATGCKFANYWLHNGFLQINQEKMAKSRGNFLTIRDIVQKFDAEDLRYVFLSSHYRSPLEYDIEKMQFAHSALTRLYLSLRNLDHKQSVALQDNIHEKNFILAMNDDFNTPKALAVLFELVREINSNKEQAASLAKLLVKLAGSVGLLYQEPIKFFQDVELDVEEVEQLINTRTCARQNKNWEDADQVRLQLQNMGLILEDGPTGTLWRVK